MRKDKVVNLTDQKSSADTNSLASQSYGYTIATAGFAVWFINGMYTAAFSVFLTPMQAEFGWSRAEISAAFSLSTILSGVSCIFMGRLTDKLGPRFVVTVFGSFLGISYLLMSQIVALWQFELIYAVVVSIGISSTLVPVMSTIVRWFVKKRGLVTGIVQSGVGIGGMVVAPLTAWLILTYGWRFSYFIIGIVALVGIIASGLFLKSNPDSKKESAGDGSITRMDSSDNPVKQGKTGYSLHKAMKTRQFWIMAGLYFTFGFCRSAFLPHTAAFVQDKGFSLFEGANVVAILTLSSVFGRIIIGRLADKIGNHRALIISESLTTVSFALGLISNDLWMLFLYGVIFGFGWGAQAVLRFSLAAEEFGLVAIGAVMGVLSLAEATSASFGSYIAGYIFDTFGNYQPAFWLGIAISIISIVFAPMGRRC